MHLADPTRPAGTRCRPFHALLAALALALALGACGDGGSQVPGGPDGGAAGADAAADAASPTGDTGPIGNPICGDGDRADDEACDDGNDVSGDGCSDACELEADFACPTVGDDCVKVVICGNGRIEGGETCDDGDTESGNGCSDACQVELGWTCPVAGIACSATACGDGYLAGFEVCDDGDSEPGDGCGADCKLEDGYKCDVPGADCELTVCGDGDVEGTEECDDGNAVVGDGCTPLCTSEPQCAGGSCTAVCGDGVLWAPEECDDGNGLSGDGCSADCEIEQGFTCDEIPLPDPPEVTIPITVRDFIAADTRLEEGEAGAAPPYGHPDFEWAGTQGMLTGMVEDELDADGKPVRIANGRTASDAYFAMWYRSDDDVNRSIARTLTLQSIGAGVYQIDSDAFFPADGDGFTVETCSGSPCEPMHENNLGNDHDFHFTTEARYWFEYSGTEVLEFSGDDDVWVFINGKLAVDLGGLHAREDASVTLSDQAASLGLVVGGIYEAVVFHAERHTTASQYRLTLTNFNRAPSTCGDLCGDGVASSQEVCDDGADNGDGDGSAYGGCSATCLREPHCGDGVTDTDFGEVCDDGLNLGGDASSCAPGCQSMGAACGDGVVQTSEGEQCDDGNTEDGDGCTAECQIQIG